MILVVDASVVVKWFVQEPLSEQALDLVVPGLSRIAPDLVFSEVGNALWVKMRRGEIASDQAKLAFESLESFFDRIVSSKDLAVRALEIAEALDHPIYDCFYLACAENLNGVVITADRRLSNRVQSTAFEDRVALLADFDFGQFVLLLQIPTEKVEEIVRLWKRVDVAFRHLSDILTAEQTSTFKIVNTGDLKPVFDSPVWINLFAAIEALPGNELVDLLALGWLGQGYSGTDWQILRDRAETALGNHDTDYLRYVCSLSCYLERGLTVLQDR